MVDARFRMRKIEFYGGQFRRTNLKNNKMACSVGAKIEYSTVIIETKFPQQYEVAFNRRHRFQSFFV